MTNRVQAAIEKMRKNPDLDNVSDSAVTVGFKEHAFYQDLQSMAFASDKLTMDEAYLIYNALGEAYSVGNNGWASGIDKATKVVVTRVIIELSGIEKRSA